MPTSWVQVGDKAAQGELLGEVPSRRFDRLHGCPVPATPCAGSKKPPRAPRSRGTWLGAAALLVAVIAAAMAGAALRRR